MSENRAYVATCSDCQIQVSVPTDSRPMIEHRVCLDCYRARWDKLGRPVDHHTGEIRMEEAGKVVRWSTPVRN